MSRVRRKTRAEFEQWKKQAELKKTSSVDINPYWGCGCFYGEWCECEGPDVRCTVCEEYVEDEEEHMCSDCYKKKYKDISIPRYEGDWNVLTDHIRRKRQVTYPGVVFRVNGYMNTFKFTHKCTVTLVHNTYMEGFLYDRDQKNIRIHGNFNQYYDWISVPDSRGNPAVQFYWSVFEGYVNDAEGVLILPSIPPPSEINK